MKRFVLTLTVLGALFAWGAMGDTASARHRGCGSSYGYGYRSHYGGHYGGHY